MYTLYKIYYNDYCAYLGRTKQPIAARLRGHFFNKPMHKNINIALVSKIEIASCKSQADMYLYEVYYINKLKPPINQDDKAHDALTVELPELKFVEYTPKLMDKWREEIAKKETAREQARLARQKKLILTGLDE